ncbi:hypothetical protein V3C99_003759 [Haemonchus contortus]|uniref:DZANK-type domain-containing protein n=1 Tax=Haemonchus contortus TaxID=6289 RepID=A0A7I5E6D5_HAECO|nr:unnamed protein product [Haemonchus contortus]
MNDIPMSGKLATASDPPLTTECPVCHAKPPTPTDQFCRRCGCRLHLVCRHCQAQIKPLDRYCASCGARRLIIFDQIRQGAYNHSPFFALGTAIVLGSILGSAWLALRYVLENRR